MLMKTSSERRKGEKTEMGKFSLDAAKKNVKSSSGNEIANLENQEEYDFQFIRIEKIKPNPKNDYPMEIIEKLKSSIKEHGLQHNIVVAPIELDSNGREYEIVSGEQRYRAIKELQDEGLSIYKNGIPCKIESKDTDEIDREIMLIEANEITRAEDQVRTRKMTKRLEELYQRKNMKKGEITEKIAETLNIGKRQVQRYRNTNNNLIPELIEALDEAKISLEMASSMATLPVEAQQNIALILETSQKVSKEELESIKNSIKKSEEAHKEKVLVLEEKAKSEAEKSKELAETLKESKEKLQILEKELNQKKAEQSTVDTHDTNDTNDTNELEEQIQKLSKEVGKLHEQKLQSDQEAEVLRDQIKELTKQKSTISPEELKKLRAEEELGILVADIKKKMNLLHGKIEIYKKEYGNSDYINNLQIPSKI